MRAALCLLLIVAFPAYGSEKRATASASATVGAHVVLMTVAQAETLNGKPINTTSQTVVSQVKTELITTPTVSKTVTYTLIEVSWN